MQRLSVIRSHLTACTAADKVTQENTRPEVQYKSDGKLAKAECGGSMSTEKESCRPFHFAFPVHDIALAKEFYGGMMGCAEGRSSKSWVDYSLYGHQIVCHFVGKDFKAIDYFNPVDSKLAHN